MGITSHHVQLLVTQDGGDFGQGSPVHRQVRRCGVAKVVSPEIFDISFLERLYEWGSQIDWLLSPFSREDPWEHRGQHGADTSLVVPQNQSGISSPR